VPGVRVGTIAEGLDEIRAACGATRFAGATEIRLGRVGQEVALESAVLHSDGSSLGAGLEEADRRGVKRLRVLLDSELICRQIAGRYRVKAPALKPLFQRARELMSRFDEVTTDHVPRELNSRADELANAGSRKSKERAQKC